MVHDCGQQITFLFFGWYVRVGLDLEDVSGSECWTGTGTVDGIEPGFFLLHAPLGFIASVLELRVGVGVVIELIPGIVGQRNQSMLAGASLEAGRWFREVVVDLFPSTRYEIVGMVPILDTLLSNTVRLRSRVVDFRNIAVGVAELVGQHERMLVFLVLEVVKNAIGFE